MNDKWVRRSMRRQISRYSLCLIAYYLLMNYTVLAVTELTLVYKGFQSVIQSNTWDAFMYGINQAMEAVVYGNGWGYILVCVIAVVVIRLWKGKTFWNSLFDPKQEMTAGTFFALAAILVCGQLAFQILALIEEFLLNLVGLSVLEAINLASAGADTFSMFLYAGLGAPIVEELIFRGVIMRGLEPCGKRFAILASAVLFGLFHGNLVQTPYAFLVGLVLGYTAMEYSIWWAMVLHMVNNLVLGDMLTRLLSGLPVIFADAIIQNIILLCSIAGIVILILHRRSIRIRRSADPIDPRAIQAFCTSVPNIILFVMMSVNAVSMLFIG